MNEGCCTKCGTELNKSSYFTKLENGAACDFCTEALGLVDFDLVKESE